MCILFEPLDLALISSIPSSFHDFISSSLSTIVQTLSCMSHDRAVAIEYFWNIAHYWFVYLDEYSSTRHRSVAQSVSQSYFNVAQATNSCYKDHTVNHSSRIRFLRFFQNPKTRLFTFIKTYKALSKFTLFSTLKLLTDTFAAKQLHNMSCYSHIRKKP